MLGWARDPLAAVLGVVPGCIPQFLHGSFRAFLVEVYVCLVGFLFVHSHPRQGFLCVQWGYVADRPRAPVDLRRGASASMYGELGRWPAVPITCASNRILQGIGHLAQQGRCSGWCQALCGVRHPTKGPG